jgi:hypothetical protein
MVKKDAKALIASANRNGIGIKIMENQGGSDRFALIVGKTSYTDASKARKGLQLKLNKAAKIK